MTTEAAVQNGRRNRWTIRLLWFVAFLIVLPACGYGLQTGKLVLAMTGLPVFVFMIALSLGKLVCPACGKAMRTIGTKLSNCPYCGTAYTKKS